MNSLKILGVLLLTHVCGISLGQKCGYEYTYIITLNLQFDSTIEENSITIDLLNDKKEEVYKSVWNKSEKKHEKEKIQFHFNDNKIKATDIDNRYFPELGDNYIAIVNEGAFDRIRIPPNYYARAIFKRLNKKDTSFVFINHGDMIYPCRNKVLIISNKKVKKYYQNEQIYTNNNSLWKPIPFNLNAKKEEKIIEKPIDKKKDSVEKIKVQISFDDSKIRLNKVIGITRNKPLEIIDFNLVSGKVLMEISKETDSLIFYSDKKISWYQLPKPFDKEFINFQLEWISNEDVYFTGLGFPQKINFIPNFYVIKIDYEKAKQDFKNFNNETQDKLIAKWKKEIPNADIYEHEFIGIIIETSDSLSLTKIQNKKYVDYISQLTNVHNYETYYNKQITFKFYNYEQKKKFDQNIKEFNLLKSNIETHHGSYYIYDFDTKIIDKTQFKLLQKINASYYRIEYHWNPIEKITFD